MDCELLHLTTFVEEEIKKLKAFKKYWRKARRDEPECITIFPLQMPEGDWCEHFDLFKAHLAAKEAVHNDS